MKNVFKVLSIVFLILTMIAIYLFSNQNGVDSSDLGENVANGLVRFEFFRWLFNIFPYRKVAHFVIYTALGFAATMTLYVFDVKLYSLFSCIFCVIYACSDEFHQLFVDGRGPMIKDVLIDSIGSIFGIIIVICLISVVHIFKRRKDIKMKRKQKRKYKKQIDMRL